MKLAILQNNPVYGEIEQNLHAVAKLMNDEPADLWLLPELFQSGYHFGSREEASRLAEEKDGPTFSAMHTMAQQKNCYIAYGWAEKSGEKLYNSASLVGPDGLSLHYRKLHLFDNEKHWFDAGDLPFSICEIHGVRLGLMICFDWRFPEAARSLAFLGADLILHPSNLVMPFCPDAMITRALENNVYIATADRWGKEQRCGNSLRFIGRSQLISPQGQRIAALGEEDSAVLYEEIDVKLARNRQINENNHLFSDRQPQFYEFEPETF